MQVAHCSKIDFNGGWPDPLRQVSSEEQDSIFGGWQDTTIQGKTMIVETELDKGVGTGVVGVPGVVG